MATNGASTNGGIHPHIVLYTNHGCPFAHRAHIALKELDLPYEEVLIDLDTPREPWYLEINPRGLVPSIKYSDGLLKDEIITESAIVAQFLADARPGHLLPASHVDPNAPLVRARVAFFTDTWNTKVQSYLYAVMKADGAEKEKQAQDLVAAIEKEIEPLLKDAAPFFGGSQHYTLAETIVAPFLLRYYSLSQDGELIPSFVKEQLQKLPNFGKWADKVLKQESLLYIWDDQKVLERTKARVAKMKQQAKI